MSIEIGVYGQIGDFNVLAHDSPFTYLMVEISDIVLQKGISYNH
jgi:hypothetical protein